MDKKGFYKRFLYLPIPKQYLDKLWQWIEQYGKEQRVELIEALQDATLHFTQRTFSKRPCTTCKLVTKLFNKPFGCVKELKNE